MHTAALIKLHYTTKKFGASSVNKVQFLLDCFTLQTCTIHAVERTGLDRGEIFCDLVAFQSAGT